MPVIGKPPSLKVALMSFSPRFEMPRKKVHWIHDSCDLNTQIFRDAGEADRLQAWVKFLREFFDGDVVPYAMVPYLVGVSRQAVFKRACKGKLTVYVFVLEGRAKTARKGIVRRTKRAEFKMVPSRDVVAWREELNGEKSDGQES